MIITLWPQAEAHLGSAAGPNDPKPTSKVSELPRQSLDLSSIETLWRGLKQAVHARKLSNVSESKQLREE